MSPFLRFFTYNAKAKNFVEFSAFEPRSGEGGISRRDVGTEIAQQSKDRVARRSVSKVGIPLKGVGHRPGVEKHSYEKKRKSVTFSFFRRPNGPGIEPYAVIALSYRNSGAKPISLFQSTENGSSVNCLK